MEFGTVEKLGIAVDASLAILFRPIFTENREVIASLRKQSSTKNRIILLVSKVLYNVQTRNRYVTGLKQFVNYADDFIFDF